MFGLFKKRKPSVVIATLNARLQPLDRAALEEAFEAAMTVRGHRIRVVGGGTQMAANGEVIECDIEIEIDELSELTVDAVTETLATMLAPKGSTLYLSEQDRRIDFGAGTVTGRFRVELPGRQFIAVRIRAVS
ncbi:hypothetical protein AU252_22290 [Pseudarthrobacter sulfonivorans]|uniref:Uncharacterized protein n=1 Tax=Pseudarthrobacter sulfonivorans TaxID=121292 RepID=A0A0U3Q9X3_9MICC|nr:hypothetical protein [Pseudarthrobacter sulfonivorans]ALV43566.1 hypothetical protein AU252_22290 [Pseudarthrobacter sulfonivorans]